MKGQNGMAKQKRLEDAEIVLVGEMPVCDPSKIPAGTRRVIGKTLFEAVAAAFQDPAVQEDYQRWKAERERKRELA